ncbi:MAG TPA: hypothetical protein VLG37_01595 [Candidatus Saccharimonadales bacterium]|nr:hypothetical protein [Candidatus Saccharimonadales bacterium]
MSEYVRFQLSVEGSVDPERLPELIQRLSGISESMGIAFSVGDMPQHPVIDPKLKENLQGLNKSFVEFSELPNGRKIPVVTFRTLEAFASGGDLGNGRARRAWNAVGQALLPFKGQFEPAHETDLRLSEAQWGHFGHIIGSSYMDAQIGFLYAQRFAEFLDIVRSRQDDIRNFGATSMRFLDSYHAALFNR